MRLLFLAVVLGITLISSPAFAQNPSAIVPTPRSVELLPQWNMVAMPVVEDNYAFWSNINIYVGQQRYPLTTAVQDGMLEKWVFWYDNTKGGYQIENMLNDARLVPWRAYWVWNKTQGELVLKVE